MNAVFLKRAISVLRSHAKALCCNICRRWCGWEHMNLTGDYLWRASAKIGAGKFRPLRPA